MIYNGFSPELELAHRQNTDYTFGAASKKCIALIPPEERIKYLPDGQTQAGRQDTSDCATRNGCIEILETKFNYLYQNNKLSPENKKWLEDAGYIVDGKVTFSDRFIAIKSGTTREGNSLKAPLDAAHRYGLIPKPMFPLESWMMWEDYMDASKITKEMDDLGAESLRRFNINYDRVSLQDFDTVLKEDMLSVGVHAWDSPVNGVYQKSDGPFNHGIDLILLKYTARDSYQDVYDGDYVKSLSPDFVFFPDGYRLYLSEITQEIRDIQMTVFEILQKYGLLSIFAAWLEAFTRGSFGGAVRSPLWRDLRNEFLRENPECAVCDTKGTLLNGLEAHHVTPYSVDPSKELDKSNLRTLCRRCHLIFGHVFSFRSFNQHLDEDIRIWRDKIKARP